MKLKILLLAGLTTLSASAFAGRNSTPDLRNAVALSCKSAGLGYFNLINLDGDAAYVSSRKNPIVITKQTDDTLGFKYRDQSGYKFKLVFSKVVNHEDVSQKSYQTLAGVFVNGDIETEIECNVHAE